MGVGPREHSAGFGELGSEVSEAARDGIWVVERATGDGWHEVERTASRADAEAALDQLAAAESIDLGDLRVRELD